MEKYEQPIISVVHFEKEDIVTTSATSGNDFDVNDREDWALGTHLNNTLD